MHFLLELTVDPSLRGASQRYKACKINDAKIASGKNLIIEYQGYYTT
jgi:hypothetical protein